MSCSVTFHFHCAVVCQTIFIRCVVYTQWLRKYNHNNRVWQILTNTKTIVMTFDFIEMFQNCIIKALTTKSSRLYSVEKRPNPLLNSTLGINAPQLSNNRIFKLCLILSMQIMSKYSTQLFISIESLSGSMHTAAVKTAALSA